ncbi:hypothetical protein [Staphylococcus chromogenes]|uniref:hypothetical protein n=2 Tax=Staphylococcus chromogenes TaxID=46126 RepID=UPI000D03D6EC|nr:hypothetical protein [Staphylococcus chromogenes]PTF57046.1 hypothetical protein BUY04_07935 [Staphylococcus chromogenes]PTG00727.1 hypothetical protein BU663_03295 [Staphylococcus chromogenes]PTG45302.1 hypothetical protein BUY09_07180 [Staphylococcus chromogenes]
MIKFIKLNWAYFLVGAIGGVIAVTLILLLQYFLNWIEGLKITISILALFCTFLGAYLGAKISGDNARTLEIEKQNRTIDEKVLSVKTLIKMHLYLVMNIHEFICQYYFINREEFLTKTIDKRNELFQIDYTPIKAENGELQTIEFINKYMATVTCTLMWKRDLYKDIDDVNNLIKELTIELIHFKESDINTIYQLKQALESIKGYIVYDEKQNGYSMPKAGQDFENIKGVLMLFNITLIDLSENVLNIDVKESIRKSDR